MVAPREPPLPPRIGRYEVVGRLASGGMAEVLLARLHGPFGFERPVVVKRILPHLAASREIVDLFLDEARTIANLRHPNLVPVHELGSDDGELYLAMEYLEGETVWGLCRRLARDGAQLDVAIAAHIVAEACAGLHFAHEATTSDGRPLELVHRDISPQNIFVTYAGAVHVIDFGIAKTAAHAGRTEAGHVRGKYEYMAPEQVRAMPLDRRADVFASGVVLFETASGWRAYRRENPAASMLAIATGPVPRLRAARPDVPEELDAICARAMALDRSERFATAAELRRALLDFARRTRGGDLGAELADVMRRLFPERIAEKAEMLRRVREGSEVTLPAADVDVHVDLPAAEGRPTAAVMGLTQSIASESRDARARRRLGSVVAATVALLAGGAIAVLVASPPSRSAPAIASASSASGDVPSATPSAAVSAIVEPVTSTATTTPNATTTPSAAAPKSEPTRASGSARGPRRLPKPTPTIW